MTRRTAIGLLAASPLLAGRGQSYPPERFRYADPATEGEVFRLTRPDAASLLPAASHHCVSSRGNFLLFSSDRSGAFQLHRLDLKSGESRQLTGDAPILPASPAMPRDERRVFYTSGAIIKSVTPSGAADRDHFTASAPIEAFHITDDGVNGLAAAGGKLLLVPLGAAAAKATASANTAANAAPRTLAEGPGIGFLLPRPRRASLVYQRGIEWFLAHHDGSVNRALKPLEGSPSALWSPDGKTLFFLRGSTLFELDPDTGTEKLFARTSNFAQFTCNADASVFAGISGSIAQPHVLLLLRVTRRERTICEHKSSHPAALFFSPNSQNLFYQSDRDGKPAIYMVNIDRLVEKIDEA